MNPNTKTIIEGCVIAQGGGGDRVEACWCRGKDEEAVIKKITDIFGTTEHQGVSKQRTGVQQEHA